uniref:Putative secreted protein n=1 Tax=Rhipicephalus microplus TaxID=6941 RepID=A0A6G5A1I2_RHIMP
MFKLAFLFCCCLCICSVHLDAFEHAWPVKGTLYLVRAKKHKATMKEDLATLLGPFDKPFFRGIALYPFKEMLLTSIAKSYSDFLMCPAPTFPLPKFLGSVSECVLRRVYSLNNSCRKLVCTHF